MRIEARARAGPAPTPSKSSPDLDRLLAGAGCNARMVQLMEGRVYRAWALVTRAGRGMHQMIDVQAEGEVPYAVFAWRWVGEVELAASRVALDVTRLRLLDWPHVDLLYTGRVDLPAGSSGL